MGVYVLDIEEIDRSRAVAVGGKGARLAELSGIEGIRVPPGFCVTTDAFKRIMDEAAIDDWIDRLGTHAPDDQGPIGALCAEVRRTIEAIAMPDDVAAAITGELARFGDQAAYAVRSRATAEDLATASFAGQLDSYLNLVGPAAVLQQVRRCWASLFSDRAVTYRLRHGFDHRTEQMAVVVQQMVFAEAAGVVFTADPVTSNRRSSSVEAGLGLGEDLASGRANSDLYKVRDGEIIARTVVAKPLAIHAAPGGGTEALPTEPAPQTQSVLTDTQIV